MWANGLAVILAIAGLFVASVACSNPDGAAPTGGSTAPAPSQPLPTTQIPDGVAPTWGSTAPAPSQPLPTTQIPDGVAPTGVSTAPAPSQPPPTTQIPDGSTWVLQMLDGSPLIEGTFAWLKVDGHTYSGFDGCNTFGGKSEDGTPVASADGEFTIPPAVSTLIGCEFPHGIMDQADSYLELLKHGERFRVVDDLLEILDEGGEARLVFVRQVPLPGRPVELVGTEWQLAEDNGNGDVKAAILVFLDDQLAVGMTACRGYVASYEASGERLDFRSTSMTEYTSSCSEDIREREGQFTDNLSRATEYSISEEDGIRRLRIRTSRGRTVTFEPLATGVESVSDVEWRLKAFVSVDQDDSDQGLLRVTRLVPGTEVTVGFGEDGVGGSGGCNRYASQPESGGFLINEDGSIDIDDDIGNLLALCPYPVGIMEQERRYIELLPKFERYRIYGDLLVVRTEDATVLLFQAE